MKKIFFLFTIFSTSCLIAQTNRIGALEALAHYGETGVKIRWAPNNPLSWQQCNKGVFTIERKAYLKDSTSVLSENFALVTKNVRCMTLEEMKTKLGPNSEYGAIAAQAIYGKEFKSNGNAAQDLLYAKSDLENRYSFSLIAAENDFKVAEAIGLGYVDKTIENGFVYIYKIYVSLPNSTDFMDTAYAIVSTVGTREKPNLPQLNLENAESSVRLNWSQNGFQQYYLGYFIDRRKKGTTEWIRLNKKPIVRLVNDENLNQNMVYVDSLSKNYEVYEYRLSAITTFSEVISDQLTHFGFGKDLTPPEAPVNLTVEETIDNHLKLGWKKLTKESDFAGFIVQRAYSVEGPYTTIHDNLLSKNEVTFIDKNYNAFYTNYYQVLAVDTSQNTSTSYSIYAYVKDSIAPSAPTIPMGTVSTKGIVKLSWNLGKEKDIKGYRVYRANQEDHDFVNMTPEPITDTIFIDTISLKTLTKKVHYKIAAVDYHFNHSELSPALSLKRPDIIPPASPVFHNIAVSDSVVILKWYNSPSEDLKETTLYRQTNNEKMVKLISFADSSSQEYKDRSLISKNTYRYFLQASDESGLTSEISQPVDAYIYNNKPLPAVSGLMGKAAENKKSIQLTWTYPNSDKYYVVVYRSYNQTGFQAIKSVPKENSKCLDNEIIGKGIYAYKLVVFFENGTQSLPSEIVQITID